MNRTLIALALSLAAGAALAQLSSKADDARLSATADTKAVPVDRIVAVVNNDVITLHELNERKSIVLRQLQKQETPLPPQDVIDKQVLERMINEMVQLQLAKETGIRVDDTQLDRTLQRIADENKLSMTAFRAAIEKDGMDYSKFREDIRNEIIQSRLREREVDNAITVNDGEIDNQLSTQANQQAREQEYRLAHILVQVPEQATPDQIETRRKRAEAALAQLSQGQDFGQVAASFSDAPDALQGGSLGWRSSSRMPALFVEPLSTLKDGEATRVLRSPAGFHIVKLLERRSAAAAPPVAQTQVRHILLKSKDGVADTELRSRAVALKEKIDQGADFMQVARQQSEDASAARGGDLGWIAPGDTVPEFERAMTRLAPGQVSEPVQTPFGWHLIQVVDRRQEQMSEERRRTSTKLAVRARKSDEAYQEWLRQIRDKAYVENRLEER